MSTPYVPMYYYENVKRPGEKPFLDTIIKNHLVSLFLAFTWLSPTPVIHLASMFLLSVAFWCIYEVGYYENDTIAEKYEENPHLSEAYYQYKSSSKVWQPWLWSIILSVIGLVLLSISENSSWLSYMPWWWDFNLNFDWKSFGFSFSIWVLILVSTRLTFWIYNYLDKKTRTWFYPLLQMFKYFGLTAIAYTNILGLALLLTQVLVEWVPYIIYRWSEQVKYDKFPHNLFRIVAFTFLSVAASVTLHETDAIVSFQFLAILLWCMLRGRAQLREAFSQAYSIKREKNLDDNLKSASSTSS